MSKILKLFYIGNLENSHHGMVNHLNRITQEWQRVVTLVKQSQELKTVSYHKLYDILKQHQNEVNEIRAERLAQPTMVADDDEMSKDKEIDKLMALISLSFKKIYKPTNNNLRTSSNTNRANQDNTPRINRGTRYDKQADWRDDTDDEPDDQELEAHYMYMAHIQEVTPDVVDNSGQIFDAEPLQKLVEIILFIIDSGCSKHMTGNLKLLTNFVEKFLGTVKFGNDQIAPILGYGDLVQGTITIKSVYYVKGLNHNLFSVGQFCDVDLEVAFRKSTCYIRDLKGNDLLTGSRGTYLYSITLQDTYTPTLICLMAKASSSQSWL
ncbi:hypothetical protein Tco_0635344 [Tanacetum coccineum]